MTKLRYLFGALLWCSVVCNCAFAVDMDGANLTYDSTHASDGNYLNGSSITVRIGGSLFAENEVSLTGALAIDKDFIHYDTDSNLLKPEVGFKQSGSFAFTEKSAILTADSLNVGQNFTNGVIDDTGWDLGLNVNSIEIGGKFTAETGSIITINPNDWDSGPSLTASNIDVNGGLYMGESAGAGAVVNIVSGADDNTYTITTAGDFDVDGDVNAAKGKLVVDAGNAAITGDLLGNVAFDVDGVITVDNVNASGSITADTSVDINGNLTGIRDTDDNNLKIGGGTVSVGKDVLGNVDFDVDSLNIGGVKLNPDVALDWKNRFTNSGNGDLLASGNMESTGDIIIGGTVDGELDITTDSDNDGKGDADMWVGEDLLGYLGINVKDLYVLGSIDGAGNIKADEVNVGGDLIGGNGGLVIEAGEVNVDGDLSGDLNIDADEIFVNRDVLGGTKFRPNLPNNSLNGDAETQFHINPNGSTFNNTTGKYDLFKQTDLTISGTYYFDNDSYLQLVLNSKTANSDGKAEYNPEKDDALITVGGFDATRADSTGLTPGVTSSPNFMDMDSTPNIEILVDNLDVNQAISKIKLIEVTGGGTLNLGDLDFAGLWFYWDDDNDGVADMRLFQETKLVAENNNVYAMVAMMNSIESLTRLSVGVGGNDVQVAGAVDDLILHRLRNYPGYTTDDLAKYYTSVMRILFPQSDIYYELMLNGGAYLDAVDVMVSENPNYALNFVRGVGLDNVAKVGGKLAISGRVSRNAVSDQLMEDFIWTRYKDKNVGWVRMGFGSDITSFNFGIDTKVNKKVIAGLNFGYNSIDFGDLDGSTVNFGLYGTYELNKIARLYANANLAVHSAHAKTNGHIVGEMKTKLSAVDTTFDFGILHKIFDQYITGRGYLTFGMLGGYDFTQRYQGADFMDVSAENELTLAPGYEVSLGKDIWFSVSSFMRPSIKLGVEYDLLGDGSRDLEFKFSEVDNWRKWKGDGGDSLWLRFGSQIDFSFIVGTNISIGYEVLKNGDFKANQFKLNGTYRF